MLCCYAMLAYGGLHTLSCWCCCRLTFSQSVSQSINPALPTPMLARACAGQGPPSSWSTSIDVRQHTQHRLRVCTLEVRRVAAWSRAARLGTWLARGPAARTYKCIDDSHGREAQEEADQGRRRHAAAAHRRGHGRRGHGRRGRRWRGRLVGSASDRFQVSNASPHQSLKPDVGVPH